MARIKQSSRHKLQNKKKSPYNNGGFTDIGNSIDSSYIAYRDSKYYITKPYIDKIVICGDPPNLSKQELADINDFLYQEAQARREGRKLEGSIDIYPVPKSAKGWVKSYMNHYTVTQLFSVMRDV